MNKKVFIPISALMGALLLALFATMTPFVAEPDRAYAQSPDTTLYELGIDSTGGAVSDSLMPEFVPSQPPVEGGHTTYASNDITSLTLTAKASHTAANVVVKAGASENAADTANAVDEVSGTPGTYTIDNTNGLQGEGLNTVILITVTAADGVGEATYKVTVERGAAGSAVVSLSALKIIAGADDEVPHSASGTAFSAGDASYTGTATVAYATRSVEVMATPTDSSATVAVTSNKDSDVQNNVVDLSEGANVIKITVTAADKATVSAADAYQVTVTRVDSATSARTTLAVLTVNDGNNDVSLSPRFARNGAPVTSGYTAVVVGSVSTVNVTATASDTGANVAVTSGASDSDEDQNGDNVSGSDPYAVTLGADGTDTVILVTVTAADGVSKAIYKVTVERGALNTSTVTNLSALSLMAGGDKIDITPAFDTATNSYTANVPNSTMRVDVMATPTNRGATAAVTSNKDSNVQNNRVDLSEGDNVITITVTAADGTTESSVGDGTNPAYTVTVRRAASTDARVTTLTKLLLETGTTSTPEEDNDVSLMPEFASDGPPAPSGYTAYVVNGTTAVAVTADKTHVGASVAVTSGASDSDEDQSGDNVSGSDPYAVTLETTGPTVILITVTAADEVAMATYKVTVMVGATGSGNTTLSDLSLMAGGSKVAITPAFISTTNAYTATVAYATRSVEVMATPAGRGATAAVMSNKDSDVQGNVVDLSEGANVITITVTAADKATVSAVGDGTNPAYTVTVTRVESDRSTDTTLSNLVLEIGSSSDTDTTNDISLMPKFVANSMPAEDGYTGAVAATVTDDLTLTVVKAHTGATVAVKTGATEAAAMKADALSATGNEYTVPLQAAGLDTVILVTVTAADLVTTGTYKITISKPAEAANADLKELSLGDDVTLLPGFDPTAATVEYRAIVEIPSVTVVAMPRNSRAKVTVASDKDNDIEDNVVDLAEGVNVITITVRPANATDATNDKMYTIRVRRDLSGDASLASLGLKSLPMNMMEGMSIDLSPAFDSGTTTYSADAGNADEITVTAKAMHPEAMVSVTVNGTPAMMTDVPAYWDMLGCPAMNDSVRMYDDHNHPDDATSPYCTTYHMDATHPGLMGDAKDVVDRTFANYYDIPLMVGNNTIRVMVTAEDGRATETYMVTVTREDMSDEARLLARYDADMNGGINDVEIGNAIVDFSTGTLSPEDMGTVIVIWVRTRGM